MELAGVVLGAVPVVITTLQYYKDTKKLGGRFLNRKKHVEKLIRALREHHGELLSNLDWLLKAIDEESDQDISNLLQQPDVRSRMVDYLGTGGSESFTLALENAQHAVESIARNIRGFLVESPVRLCSSLRYAFHPAHVKGVVVYIVSSRSATFIDCHMRSDVMGKTPCHASAEVR